MSGLCISLSPYRTNLYFSLSHTRATQEQFHNSEGQIRPSKDQLNMSNCSFSHYTICQHMGQSTITTSTQVTAILIFQSLQWRPINTDIIPLRLEENPDKGPTSSCATVLPTIWGLEFWEGFQTLASAHTLPYLLLRSKYSCRLRAKVLRSG